MLIAGNKNEMVYIGVYAVIKWKKIETKKMVIWIVGFG